MVPFSPAFPRSSSLCSVWASHSPSTHCSRQCGWWVTAEQHRWKCWVLTFCFHSPCGTWSKWIHFCPTVVPSLKWSWCGLDTRMCKITWNIQSYPEIWMSALLLEGNNLIGIEIPSRRQPLNFKIVLWGLWQNTDCCLVNTTALIEKNLR